MSIDTEMPGKPEDVFAVADWLESLRKEMKDCDTRTGNISSSSYGVWEGDSGDAYRDFNKDLKKATDEIEDRADDAEDKTRSYGLQLKWRKEDMADHRTTAREGGLTVAGTVIQQPPDAVSPGDLKAGHTPAEKTAWDKKNTDYKAAKDKVDLYNDLVKDVKGTFDQLDTWVTENLVDMEKKASSPFSIAAMAGVLSGLGFGIPENTFTKRAHDLRAAATTYAADLARRRSGNPAVRAGSKSPRQASIDKASKPGTKAGNMFGKAGDLDVWGKRLARGGVVTAVALGAWEISQGKSPTTVAVETGTGLAVGALGTLAVGAAVTAGAPVLAVVAVGAGVVLVGAGAAYAAGWAYEKFVPQVTREKIDEGIKDAWNGAGDKIGDAWDAVF